MYNERGHRLLAVDDLDTAIEDFDSSIITEPYNAPAYRGRGLIYHRSCRTAGE